MSTIAWPTGIYPRSFAMWLKSVQRVHASPTGGSEQAVDLLNDRWMVSMEIPADLHATNTALEAFINALRGQTNTCNLYHFGRPAVRGTMTSATCGAASQGASSVTLTVTGTKTLLAGDMIGIGGQLLQVAADASGTTTVAVTLVNRLRSAITAGAAVTFAAPTATFRLINTPAVTYRGGAFTDSIALEFAEVVA